MGGAAPFLLHETFGGRRSAFDFGGHGLLARPDHHGCGGDAGLADGAEHMREQRAPGKRMQHLRPRRTHARALAGREHDGKTGSSRH